MTHWKKTSILTTVFLVAFIGAFFYIFNLKVSIPSSDIEFSPWQEPQKVSTVYENEKPTNIIIFIVDGLGFGHLSMALQTLQKENQASVWQQFDVKGWHDARSAYGPLTDSEASATAMATGTSTGFGHIGIDQDQQRLKNILELAAENEYSTGIVTDSYIWDGTPAGFLAHTRDEDDAREILTQISASKLNLIFGELEDLGEGKVPEEDETIEILSRRFHLLDETLQLPNGEKALQPIAAIFKEDEIQDLNSTPNLSTLINVALDFMTSLKKPFVLLVESEEMDAASHENDSDRVMKGLESIQHALSQVVEYSKENGQTLVLFTSDHETGGLAAVADFNTYPNLQIRWTTKDHSAEVVPLFSLGPGAEYFADVNRNWEIGDRLKQLIAHGNHNIIEQND